MPSKDRDDDGSLDERPRDKHRRTSKSERSDRDRERDRERRKERERDPEREKERERRRSHKPRSKLSGDGGDSSSHLSSPRKHRSSRRERSDDDERGSRRGSKDMSGSRRASKDMAGSTSEILTGTPKSAISSKRVSLPYPSFSKAHSKEAVMSRDDLSPLRREAPVTPEPTDAGDEERRTKSSASSRKGSVKKTATPPSPPETEMSEDKRRSSAPGSEVKKNAKDSDRLSVSGVSRSKSHNDDRSKVSRRSGTSSQATYVKSSKYTSHEKIRSAESRLSSSSQQSARNVRSSPSLRRRAAEGGSSPSSVQGSSPRTPTQPTSFPTHLYTSYRDEDGEGSIPSKTATPASVVPGPPPPPPPPPPPVMNISEVPRVDYLLQHGGLPQPVSRHFLSVLPAQTPARGSQPPLMGTDILFAPFFNLLDQYNKVLDKQGSLAVATGHRTVARRLLERLENVFSRDLPAQGCVCIMCERSGEIHEGLTWGDVLEWVSGRIDLPRWPPIDLVEIGAKAAEISAEEPARPTSPIKLDPDIAEEFREHYLRQTHKVRNAVDKWLNSTGEIPAPPPQDIDDETLSFAVLTNLDDEDRPFFNALLSGSRELRPATRAPTPLHKPRTDFIVKAGLALQRLYRLQQTPRDAETATYLVKNPHTHDLLVALSNISYSEWEILTSGRFDGFLWSGADDGERSRSTTPYSRGATPASFVSSASSTLPGGRGQAVSHDEEAEMAAIAEIEREIYTGMENLEDAFERLHLRAEVVRTALRQRGAGLMQSLQNRRKIDVLSTPAPDAASPGIERAPSWTVDEDTGAGSDSEWGGDDFDIMPDDSASNISSSRHRRPKRRTERRTPAPIEEDEEE